MPPALSDDENGVSSGEEEIPYRGKETVPATEEAAQDEADEEGEEDEYVVEKILTHKIVKGTVLYDVKWLGYDDPKDRTWEPEDNLEGALDILHEYWEEIGGRPEPGKGKKRKGRKSTGAEESETGTPAATTKRPKKEVEWSPPPGSWENEVEYVDTVVEEEGVRYALLIWNNQKKTQHPLHHVYQKCPQKMLQYYESHLVFTPPKETNGDDKDAVMKNEV